VEKERKKTQERRNKLYVENKQKHQLLHAAASLLGDL
jgi:hypothetical protein